MEDIGWKAEAGVKPRSPKGRAAARGLDARIPLPTHFHASGRHTSLQVRSTESKTPLTAITVSTASADACCMSLLVALRDILRCRASLVAIGGGFN